MRRLIWEPLHDRLLSSLRFAGISAEDISERMVSGVGPLGRRGQQREVICPLHRFHRDPIALGNY